MPVVTRSNGPRSSAIAESLEARRLLSGGDLDPTFGSSGSGKADRSVGAPMYIAREPNGKIVVVGAVNDPNNPAAEIELNVYNPNGSVDRTFAERGRTVFDGIADGLAITPGGEILINQFFSLRLYTANGKLDPAFGAGGIVSLSNQGALASFGPVAVEADGKIVAVVDSGTGQLALDRFTAAGKLDTAFGNGGIVNFTSALSSSTFGATIISSIVAQKDGTILVAGQQTDANDNPRMVLVRCLASGKLDSAFGKNGAVFSKVLSLASGNYFLFPSIAPAMSGKFLVVHRGPDSQPVQVDRYLSNGSLDPTFGLHGTAGVTGASNTDVTYQVFVRTNGSIAVVGPSVWSLTSSGAPDKQYGSGGVSQPLTLSGTPPLDITSPMAAVIQPDGKIVALDSTRDVNPEATALVRYTLAGHLDDSFGYHGMALFSDGISGTATSLALQSDGKIIEAGDELAPASNKPTDAALARYNSDGTIDPSFGGDGRVFVQIGHDAAFSNLALAPNGNIFVSATGNAGFYGTAGMTPVYAIFSFKPDGSRNTGFGSSGEVVVSRAIVGLAVLGNGDIVTAGTARDAKGNPIGMAVTRYLPSGKIDASFGNKGQVLVDPQGQSVAATCLVAQTDGKVVVGGSIGQDLGLVRLNANGMLDASFGAGGIVMMPYIVNGAVDPASVSAIALSATGQIIVAARTGDKNPAVARFLPDGQLDLAFNQGGFFMGGFKDIESLGVQADGSVIAGGESNDSASLIRITAAGFDVTFEEPALTGTPFHSLPETLPLPAIVIQPNGDIVATAVENSATSIGTDLFRITGGLDDTSIDRALRAPVVSANGGNPAGAVDSDDQTSFAATATNWIYIDLSSVSAVTHVSVTFSGAPVPFSIFTGFDSASWPNSSTLSTNIPGHAGVNNVTGLDLVGRYVLVTFNGAANVSEIKIFGRDDQAGFKTVYSPNGGNPANGVDDNVETDFTATPIPSGPNQGQNWLIIDLGAVYNITDVNVTFDGDPSPAQFQIKAGFDSAHWPQATAWTNAVAGQNNETGLTLTGRYVLVYLSANPVNISDVQVFGTLQG